MSDDGLLKIKAFGMANRKLEARREAEKYASLVIEQGRAVKSVTSSDGTVIPDLSKEASSISLAGIRLA